MSIRRKCPWDDLRDAETLFKIGSEGVRSEVVIADTGEGEDKRKVGKRCRSCHPLNGQTK